MKMKDYENSKIIKVNCDFCGKDMECPEEMLKTSKRHMCYTCFQNSKNIKNVRGEELKNIHVDVPMDEHESHGRFFKTPLALSSLGGKPCHLWHGMGTELSKKELSKEMFGAGVYMGIQAFMDLTRDIEKNKETEPGK